MVAGAVVAITIPAGCTSVTEEPVERSSSTAPADVCALYRRISELDLEAIAAERDLGDDWPAFRNELSRIIAVLAVEHAKLGEGPGGLRADARLAAEFFPRSSDLVRRSDSFDAYLEEVPTLPGNEQVNAAAGRINDDALERCGVVLNHPKS
jgi:hypothetical protein